MTEPSDFCDDLRVLINRLKQAEIGWDAENIADALWLSQYVESAPITRPQPRSPSNSPAASSRSERTKPDENAALTAPARQRTSPSTEVGAASQTSRSEAPARQSQKSRGIPFQTPVPPALRRTLALGRALRPLRRRVNSYRQVELDEDATAMQSAERQFCLPVVQPAKERWLEVAVVVEASAAYFLWQETIRDFKQVLERQGAFRTLTMWYLQTTTSPIKLLSHPPVPGRDHPSRHRNELIDPSGRRLILVVSDCVSEAWRSGKIQTDWLEEWAKFSPLAIVQLLPGHLWHRTALKAGLEVQLGAWTPGVPNQQLYCQELPLGMDWGELETDQRSPDPAIDLKLPGLKLPIVTMEPRSLHQWARMVAGFGESWATGVWFDPGWQEKQSEQLNQLQEPPQKQQSEDPKRTALRLVRRFSASASWRAKRLAELMALVPVNLPIVYLLQDTLLPDSTPLHLAEIFMSGLIRREQVESETHENAVENAAEGGADEPKSENEQALAESSYEFVEGVRELLAEAVPVKQRVEVLDRVSEYIGRRLGRNIYSFTALLVLERELAELEDTEVIQFARIGKGVLRQMGGMYAELVEALEKPPAPPFNFPELREIAFRTARVIDTTQEPETVGWPELFVDDFTIATLERVEEEEEEDEQLEPFEFTIATVERRDSEWQINRQAGQGRHYLERLPNDVLLDMVAIPEGTFVMGSPNNERQRNSTEKRHEVMVTEFFIGRYPITQAQYEAVMETNPASRYEAKFVAPDKPVVGVSWREAMEFCQRLSELTGREYSLPSEAQWEYACRAGTETPFHFGETIHPELANYNASQSYNGSLTGNYQGETTPVNQFDVANAWGLCDMHGNVWEWCLDHYGSYDEAPTDGTARITEDDSASRVLRGGSWINNPWYCRSAYRYNLSPDFRDYIIGFRVMCRAPRILP